MIKWLYFMVCWFWFMVNWCRLLVDWSWCKCWFWGMITWLWGGSMVNRNWFWFISWGCIAGVGRCRVVGGIGRNRGMYSRYRLLISAISMYSLGGSMGLANY